MGKLQITLSVLLALSLSLPIRANEPSGKEKEKSEKQSSGQNQSQKDNDSIDYETLIAELGEILEGAVNDALEEQYAALNASFQKESEKLFESRSFWRRAAVTEGIVILGSVLTGVMVYKLRK